MEDIFMGEFDVDLKIDAVYIQINKLIIKFDKMKKEEKSTPTTSRGRSVYKYELQATN